MIRKLTAAFAAAGIALMAAGGSVAAQEAALPDIEEMSIGSDDAPVTVIEYASFTCPHCANFHENTYGDLKENYIDTGKIKFVFREVYFDRYGLWASMVARCGTDNRYFGIADQLFEKQREWTSGGDPATIVGNIRRIGKSSGLDDATLDTCLSDAAKAEALVAWYQKNAEADGIDSTPSFIIDGQKYGNMSFEDFSKILDEKIGG